ncbi:MAG: hypothetical protein J0I32_09120 [Sphingobacteriales bacterium]|nr:hypothetical protein [Sphingobacteriales bacterium]OJW00159.1 MAG: hypothetical protein BGO52_03470 [Sphingobacteriales bacterium 44-61]
MLSTGPNQTSSVALTEQLQKEITDEQKKNQALTTLIAEKAKELDELVTKMTAISNALAGTDGHLEPSSPAISLTQTDQQKQTGNPPAPQKPMKTPQGLNNAMFSLNIGAIVIGLKNFTNFNQPISAIYIFFFIMLRVKMYLDASYFLEDETPDNRPFKPLGYFLAILSWIAYSYSGYQLYEHPDIGYKFFIIALLPSTLWIVIILLKKSKDKLHSIWLVANIVYGVGTYLLIGTSVNKISLQSWITFGILFIMLAWDASICKPWQALSWKDSAKKLS